MKAPTTTPAETPTRWWTRAAWPLTLRLTALYALSTAIILSLIAASLYFTLAASIRHEQDNFLASKLRAVRVLLHENADDVAALREEAEEDWVTQQYVPVYV